MLLLTGWSQKSHLQFLLWFVYPFPMACKREKRDRHILLWQRSCDSLWGRYWVCESCVWATQGLLYFLSALVFCGSDTMTAVSNNNSSIPSTTLPCQELNMPTRPLQILQQTTNTQSSLWEKKGPSAVCGVIKTDLILGSLLRTGNGNMKVNYFNCPCVTITKKKNIVFFLYYFYWWKQQHNKKNKNSV